MEPKNVFIGLMQETTNAVTYKCVINDYTGNINHLQAFKLFERAVQRLCDSNEGRFTIADFGRPEALNVYGYVERLQAYTIDLHHDILDLNLEIVDGAFNAETR